MTVNPTVSRFAAFECLETCLAECLAREKDRWENREVGGGGGGASPLAVFYLSVHPWRLWYNKEGERRQRKSSAAIHRQSKKRERTSLQVNSERQLAGS